MSFVRQFLLVSYKGETMLSIRRLGVSGILARCSRLLQPDRCQKEHQFLGGWPFCFARVFSVALAVLVFCTGCFTTAAHAERRFFRKPASSANARCDIYIPPITTGYGADGSYSIDIRSVGGETQGTVFLPKGVATPSPVIFLAHGYGPNKCESYLPLIDHMVSRGYIVVFGTFPMFRATIDQRYADLWNGFDAAVRQFGPRMDLTRIGVVGHSFGGGATPALLEKAMARGWGGRGHLCLCWHLGIPTRSTMRNSGTFPQMSSWHSKPTATIRSMITGWRSIFTTAPKPRPVVTFSTCAHSASMVAS